MAKLDKDRGTKRRDGDFFVFEAGERIFCGAMLALDSAGLAVPASAAGGPCVGVAQNAARAGEKATARRGVFAFDNDETAPLSLADVGKAALAADDHTLAKGEGGNVAGIVMDVDSDGVWIKI